MGLRSQTISRVGGGKSKEGEKRWTQRPAVELKIAFSNAPKPER